MSFNVLHFGKTKGMKCISCNVNWMHQYEISDCVQCKGSGIIKVHSCSRCGEDIVWIRTRNDKFVAVEPKALIGVKAQFYNKALMKSHFDTCRGTKKK